MAEPRPPGLETGGLRRPDPEFFIPASASLEERQPRTLKSGDMFAVFDHNGDIVSGPGSPEGIFFEDTRRLSHLHLCLWGARPILLSSGLRNDNAALICNLTNPDYYDDAGRLAVRHDCIHIERVRVLDKGGVFERIALQNFDAKPHDIPLEIGFDADFADLFEVRGPVRTKRGQPVAPVLRDDGVALAYIGLDDIRRETTIRFDPAPESIGADKASFVITLQPGQSRSLFMEVRCTPSGLDISPTAAFFDGLKSARRSRRALSNRAASVSTSNEALNEALCRSVADLYMLVTETPQGPYPYAGIPWFSTAFGRDAIITALQTLWFDPSLALGVLRHLSALQATTVDAAADAEPGKILHERRNGEMANLGEVPFRLYYGSVDSTPLFVMLAGAYLDRTGDIESIAALWPNIAAALTWIDDYGDADGDGFVEYGRKTDEGLRNQGWKDSEDSIFHENGDLAEGPIALVEVQAYAYGAWNSAAAICRRIGREQEAADFELRAATLRQRFDQYFFCPDIGTYVLALDGEKRPCRVRSSNAGHALLTGIALPERAASVVSGLMSGASFSGFGIRTIATSEKRYNPMSYHNGSIWPHDNSLIAAGFSRYGYKTEAARIFEGVFAASSYIALRRLPELFCGFPRRRGEGPVFYPVACSPQAWATATPLHMVASCLGLGFAPLERKIHFDGPQLPTFIDQLRLSRLAIADKHMDLEVRRRAGGVVVNVVGGEGDIVITQRATPERDIPSGSSPATLAGRTS